MHAFYHHAMRLLHCIGREQTQKSCRKGPAGFTLIEMSIVVAIIAVVTAGVVSMGASMVQSTQKVATINKLNTIEDALMAYRTGNNRLPCPTDPTITDTAANSTTYGYETGTPGTCGGGNTFSYTVPSPYTGTDVEGAVPVRTLHLPDEFQFDGWGRKFAYAVWTPLTAKATSTSSPAAFINYGVTPNCGGITVENAGHGTRSTAAAYALVSFGPDGHGGYTKSGARYNAGVSNVDEDTNSHYNSSGSDTGYLATYVEKEYGNYAGDGDSTHPFAHMVRFKERWQMQDAYDTYNPTGSACTLGFVIEATQSIGGVAAMTLTVGDVNGDGIPDLIIGMPNIGFVYVVFGTKSGFPDPLYLNALNGSNGFVLNVGNGSIAVGDINNDGYNDIIIGSPNVLASGVWYGSVYVIFGGPTEKNGTAWTACTYASPCTVNATFLNGGGTAVNGFELDGNLAEGDNHVPNEFLFAGSSVAVGDVNGDGIPDIIIGAPSATTNGNNDAGAIYVVFGGATKKDGTAWAEDQTLNSTLLNGTNGAEFDGGAADVGSSSQNGVGQVVAVGDVNGDGTADIITSEANSSLGRYYAVFGHTGAWSSTPTVFNTGSGTSPLDGTHGFELDITDGVSFTYQGLMVVSDVNADGIADIIVGTNAGELNVVFGHTGAWASATNLPINSPYWPNGSNGFVILANGNYEFWFGLAAGDVNGDGINDIIIGNDSANGGEGETSVIFGAKCGGTWSTACSATITPGPSLLNGTTGAEFDGPTTFSSNSGGQLVTGDVNGDGIADLIIGAELAPGSVHYGYVYVYFGKKNGWPTTGFNLGGL
jgi:prepilin-type N-terminal cleavage/methylation domain-containing protein